MDWGDTIDLMLSHLCQHCYNPLEKHRPFSLSSFCVGNCWAPTRCQVITRTSGDLLLAGHLLTQWGWVTHICVNKLTIIVQIMACCLAGAKPLSECWNIVNWTLGNKLQWNFNQNLNIFIQENAFENVIWKMAAIWSRPQCVNELQQNGSHLFRPQHVSEVPFSVGT